MQLIVAMVGLAGVWSGWVEGDPKRPVAVAIDEQHVTWIDAGQASFAGYVLSTKETMEGKARIRAIDVTPTRFVTAAGKDAPVSPRGVALGTLRLGAGTLRLCLGAAGQAERVRLDGRGGTCYELRRVEAPAPPAPSRRTPCVQKCVERNQMKAVSIQKIEADCRKECDSVPW